MSGDRKDIFGKSLNPDGSLRCVSATQVGTFKQCPLKWHFEKKAKLPKKPMGKGAALGDKCHKQIEHFLKTGEDVRGALAHVGDSMLDPYLWAAPFNKGPGLVEEPILPSLSTPGGVLISGFEDFYVPGIKAVRESDWAKEAATPTIIDHKFKKELKKYADTEETLPNDPQQIIYTAHALLKREPAAPAIEFRLHHVQTEGEGGRFPLPVSLTSTREDVLLRWRPLARMIDTDMAAVAKMPVAEPGKTPEGVPFNTAACGNFGGCDFSKMCAHSPQNRFISALRNPTQSINKELPLTVKANPMGLLGQIRAPETAAPSTPAAPTLNRVKATTCKQGGAYMLPTGPVGKFEGVIGGRSIFRLSDDTLKDFAADAEVIAMSADKPPARKLVIEPDPAELITPPDAPPLATQPPEPVLYSVQTAPQPTPSVGVLDAPTVTVTVAEAVKPKRGRPTKAEVAARVAEVTAGAGNPMTGEGAHHGVITYDPSTGSETVHKPLTVMVPGEGEPLMLLINCQCLQAKDLSGYVADVCRKVATAAGAPDVRLGHKSSDLSFGGWKALVAMAALQEMPRGLCSIQSSELADPIIEALVPKAAMVVRGSR